MRVEYTSSIQVQVANKVDKFGNPDPDFTVIRIDCSNEVAGVLLG